MYKIPPKRFAAATALARLWEEASGDDEEIDEKIFDEMYEEDEYLLAPHEDEDDDSEDEQVAMSDNELTDKDGQR